MLLTTGLVLILSIQQGEDRQPKQTSRGLHGYIGYSSSQPEDRENTGWGWAFILPHGP